MFFMFNTNAANTIKSGVYNPNPIRLMGYMHLSAL